MQDTNTDDGRYEARAISVACANKAAISAPRSDAHPNSSVLSWDNIECVRCMPDPVLLQPCVSSRPKRRQRSVVLSLYEL